MSNREKYYDVNCLGCKKAKSLGEGHACVAHDGVVRQEIHRLKIVEPYASAVRSGVKKFEIRKNDRDFRVGDTLFLEPYDPIKKEYVTAEHVYDCKGFPIIKRISYITDFEQKDGYVVMSLQNLS